MNTPTQVVPEIRPNSAQSPSGGGNPLSLETVVALAVTDRPQAVTLALRAVRDGDHAFITEVLAEAIAFHETFAYAESQYGPLPGCDAPKPGAGGNGHDGEEAVDGAGETQPTLHVPPQDIASCVDALDLKLGQFGSVLRLLTNSSQGGEFDPGVEGVLAALESLAESADVEYGRLYEAVARKAGHSIVHLDRAGVVIEEFRAVLWVLADFCGSDGFTLHPDKAHSALLAVDSLRETAKMEIGLFWESLKKTQAGGKEGGRQSHDAG